VQGVRILTLFIYLSNVTQGGETAFFTEPGLSVQPKAGRAVLWSQVKRSTEHTHTHTDREQHPRHRHTHTHDKNNAPFTEPGLSVQPKAGRAVLWSQVRSVRVCVTCFSYYQQVCKG